MGVLGRSEERVQAVCRPRMGFLPVCEQRGRHVTRSSCRPCRHPLTLSIGRFKEPPCRFKICPPTTPSFRVKNKIVLFVDDELCGPRAISPLQVGPPTRRELAPGHAVLIFDREALRAPARFAVHSSNRQTYVNSNYPRISKESFQTHNLRADPSSIMRRATHREHRAP